MLRGIYVQLTTVLTYAMVHGNLWTNESCPYPPFKRCGDDYVHVPQFDRCLYYAKAVLEQRFRDAMLSCQERQMMLLELRSKEKANVTTELLAARYGDLPIQHWLGVQYNIEFKEFFYSRDDSVMKKTDFRGIHDIRIDPSTKADLCVRKEFRSLKWHTVACNKTASFVCEKRIDVHRTKPEMKVYTKDPNDISVQEGDILNISCSGKLYDEGVLAFTFTPFNSGTGKLIDGMSYEYTEEFRRDSPNSSTCARYGLANMSLVAEMKYDGGWLGCVTYLEADDLLKYCYSGDVYCDRRFITVRGFADRGGAGRDDDGDVNFIGDGILSVEVTIALIIVLWAGIVISLTVFMIVFEKSVLRFRKKWERRRMKEDNKVIRAGGNRGVDIDRDEDVKSNSNVSSPDGKGGGRWWSRYTTTSSTVSTILTTGTQ